MADIEIGLTVEGVDVDSDAGIVVPLASGTMADVLSVTSMWRSPSEALLIRLWLMLGHLKLLIQATC